MDIPQITGHQVAVEKVGYFQRIGEEIAKVGLPASKVDIKWIENLVLAKKSW